MNANATWSISLESYHLYPQPQNVSKNPQNYYVYSNLFKNAKSPFGSLALLGVNAKKLSLCKVDCDEVEPIRAELEYL
jgi:hypothetical protein